MCNRELDWALIQYGVYEISGTRFVQTFLEPGMTFFDIGANAGYYSLIASRIVGPSGHVYAIEPAPGPFAKLVRNLQLNGLNNVTVVRAAAGNTSGSSLLFLSRLDRNDGIGSLIPGADRKVEGDQIQVVTLPMICKASESCTVNLIKIDVEGTELDVFAGGDALLRGPSAPGLLFESFDVTPVSRFLRKRGYEVRHLHFSLAEGLQFPKLGEAFDNCFAQYEAPNYVALKSVGNMPSFEHLSARSVKHVSGVLRWLGRVA